MLTNDGHAILREIDVAHPAAKSMIQLSRAQDEEVGDGTTSVIILAGELLAAELGGAVDELGEVGGDLDVLCFFFRLCEVGGSV